jgi:peptidyl-tRNA hydrolase, PTH1 family
MKLIAGLGNPGERYKNTRHNIGFMVVDQLVSIEELPACKLSDKFRAEIVEGRAGGEKLLLVKPTTMMNLSGESVQKLMHFYKIEPHDIWVIHDELDLPLGKLRIRRRGSSGGHNGVQSIIDHIGEDFWRFRVGVTGAERTERPAEQYVLEAFNDDEREGLDRIVAGVARSVEQVLSGTAPSHDTIDL